MTKALAGVAVGALVVVLLVYAPPATDAGGATAQDGSELLSTVRFLADGAGEIDLQRQEQDAALEAERIASARELERAKLAAAVEKFEAEMRAETVQLAVVTVASALVATLVVAAIAWMAVTRMRAPRVVISRQSLPLEPQGWLVDGEPQVRRAQPPRRLTGEGRQRD